MIKIKVHGRKQSFSEDELTAILEEYYERKAIENNSITKVTSTPTEGNWFIIRPMMIDEKLFQEKRKKPEQETTRQKILNAFAEMHKYPEKYSQPFKTLYPERTWPDDKQKSLQELRNIAKVIGDDEADETEQALEWAQRIQNGESWNVVCKHTDTAISRRAIRFKNYGLHKIVGGPNGASHVFENPYTNFETVSCTVPLVVSRQNIPEDLN